MSFLLSRSGGGLVVLVLGASSFLLACRLWGRPWALRSLLAWALGVATLAIACSMHWSRVLHDGLAIAEAAVWAATAFFFAGLGLAWAAGAAAAAARSLRRRWRPTISTSWRQSVRRPLRLEPAPAPAPGIHRRQVLGAAVVLPFSFAGVGARAVLGTTALPLTPVRPLELDSPNGPRPPLRVLQISDVHLGRGRDVRDIEAFVRALAAQPPIDLLALTGDIADDADQLAPALRLLRELSPRLGLVACLGNHEYFGSVHRVRDTFARAEIPLLVSQGLRLRDGDRDLWIAGFDDPLAAWRAGKAQDLHAFYRQSAERAFAGAPDEGLRLALSHRPEGFLVSREMGADITLAGHTHGGQIGWSDRSLVSRLAPRLPFWGAYGDARARLYVTSGFGQWLRFRLGCPAEAPLLSVRGGSSRPRVSLVTPTRPVSS